jgi:protein Mpv17
MQNNKKMIPVPSFPPTSESALLASHDLSRTLKIVSGVALPSSFSSRGWFSTRIAVGALLLISSSVSCFPFRTSTKRHGCYSGVHGVTIRTHRCCIRPTLMTKPSWTPIHFDPKKVSPPYRRKSFLASVSSPFTLVSNNTESRNDRIDILVGIGMNQSTIMLTESRNEDNSQKHYNNKSSPIVLDDVKIGDSSLAQMEERRQEEIFFVKEMSTMLESQVKKTIEDVFLKFLQTNQPTNILGYIVDDSQPSALDYKDIVKKTLNAGLLLLCFTYAAYTVFTIDASLTRGWTQSEIAMRIPIDTWSSYESSLEDNPIYTKTLINVIIYVLGDWLSQTLFQKKNVLDFDAMRTIRNGFIGLCFGPLVHEYYQFSDAILPVEGGMFNRIQKIIMDQSIYLVVKCSIYIMAIGLLQGDSISVSWNNVKSKIKGICFTAWKFWPFVHLVTYNVIPARHRILWVNCVDLVWNAILASKVTAVEDAPPLMPQTHNETVGVVTSREVLLSSTSPLVTNLSPDNDRNSIK